LKIAASNVPHLYLSPPLGVTSLEFRCFDNVAGVDRALAEQRLVIDRRTNMMMAITALAQHRACNKWYGSAEGGPGPEPR